jgi:Predicted periplasmic ligand-binding sensor domain
MFKNMKIGTRLALSFSIMLVLIIALIAVGLNSILKIHQNLDEIVTNENVRVEFANKMKGDVREVSISLRTILLDKSKTDQEDQLNRIDSLRKDYDNTLVDYMKLIPKDEKEILDRIAKLNVLSDESRASNNSVIANVKAGNYEVALDEMLKVARPKVRNWIETIVGLESLEKRSSLESFEIANSTYNNVKL